MIHINKKSIVILLVITVLLELILSYFDSLWEGYDQKSNIIIILSILQLMCLSLSCFYFTPKLISLRKNIKNKPWVKDHLFGELRSPLFISIFRILYASMCIWLILQLINEGYIYLNFFGSTDQTLFLITCFHYLWLFLLLLVLFGTRRRLVYLIHFVLSCCFFDDNIGDFMLKIAAFWSIFMIPQGPIFLKAGRSKLSAFFGFDNEISIITPLWSVFLLGINLSLIITIAGIYKALDPVWLEGLGFYYSFLQPWIKVPESTFLLDQKWFVFVMNYLGIIFETLALFFFPFKRLRPLSLFMIFCFLFLVLYPLRIDPVAPAGLVIFIAVLSMQEPLFFKSLFVAQPKNTDQKTDTIFFSVTMAIFMVQLIIISIFSIPTFRYPFTSYPFEIVKNINQEEIINDDYKGALNNSFLKNKIPFIKFMFKFKVVSFGPIFNHNQSFSRSVYFIDAYSNSGKYIPFSVYNADGSIDSNGLRGGFLRPLGAHTVYGQLGVIYYKLVLSGSLTSLNDSDNKLLSRLFYFANIKLMQKKIIENIINYSIRIYNIDVPNKYVGVYNGISEENYVEISYDINSQKFKLVNIPAEVKDFSKLNIPLFENGNIRLNPF